MESIKKKRVSTFDIMKFFGIVVVIIGHMTEHFREFIFSFSYAIVFYLSGLFLS